MITETNFKEKESQMVNWALMINADVLNHVEEIFQVSKPSFTFN